jgi:hypothetical protein
MSVPPQRIAENMSSDFVCFIMVAPALTPWWDLRTRLMLWRVKRSIVRRLLLELEIEA